MKLLAIDTAMAACSVAIIDCASGRVLSGAMVPMERGHAEALAPMVAEVMAAAGADFDQLSCVAVTRGPGTFTGLRIGLSFARGLGLALNIPVVGLDTLAAIAANAGVREQPLLVAADARRDEVYAALYATDGTCLMPPGVMSRATCAGVLPEGPVKLLGTGASHIIAAAGRAGLLRGDEGDLPDAAIFGVTACRLPTTGAMPEPLYLRSADAKPQDRPPNPAGTITFGHADAKDAGLLAMLHAECFANSWDETAMGSLLTTFGTKALLALDSEEPVAFILTRSVVDEAEILTIGTRPFAQIRGIGRRLLDHALDKLATEGVTRCFIEVAVGNVAARALYASAGFVTAGQRKGYYERQRGTFEDAVVMRRDLTA